MKKELLVCETPTITSFPSVAHTFAMLEQRFNTLNWLFNNYIQLVVFPPVIHEISGYFLDILSGIEGIHCYALCPFLDYFIMDKNMINKKWNSTTNFLIDMIDQDFYVSYWLDRKYTLKNRNNANEKVNPALIYGYDTDRKAFYTLDFYENGKYQRKDITFSDMENATSWINLWNQPSYDLVALMRYNSKSEVGIDIPHIKRSIRDYINMQDSTNKLYYDYTNQYKYGLYFYEDYKIRLTKKDIDVRPAHLLYDHKILMKKRLLYLNSKGFLNHIDYEDLNKKCEDLIKKTQIIRNLMILYSKKNKFDDKLIGFIELLQEEDKDFMCDVLSHL